MCHERNIHRWVRQLDTSPSTCRWVVEVYVPQDPPQEVPVVFGYIEVPCERYAPNIYLGSYTYKYIGHETTNWWGWGGR